MSKLLKFCLVLMAGLIVILVAGWITDYWVKHFIFAGPTVLIAMVISATCLQEKYLKPWSIGIFWSGIIAIFIYCRIYRLPNSPHPEQWGVIATCAIVCVGLTQLVYHIKAKPTRFPTEQQLQEHIEASIGQNFP